ncbi:hypothetical protein LHYA1_G006690 [Lachnellula hyalina]|uniref:Small EDRK-rich factor-like N-terminal domain-containing protein n=1 Tax=Lachnellula hyalina TaxID=1316788 RepID=A0A8H8TXB5_9HELO|nr:uncharacterized protein LHYA1_G006690 [Lachnellula hyalina]TVY23752.1 hypothetical protein LHYA1_G006690 [Lachnellula hyalina]
MARGNQRDKAREAELKRKLNGPRQGNSKTGSEMQRENESNAEKMRKKQADADAKKIAGGGAAGAPKKK